jgi:hypothetical protein
VNGNGKKGALDESGRCQAAQQNQRFLVMFSRIVQTAKRLGQAAFTVFIGALAWGEATAGTIQLGSEGYWSFSAYYRDDGEFGYCDMTTGSRAGSEAFTLTVGRTGYMVSLFDRSWKLSEGDKYRARVDIGEQYWEGNATVITGSAVAMTFPPDSGFGVAFAAGIRMDFSIGSFSRTLDLRGSSRALGRLAKCFTSRIDASNPFGEANGSGNPFE